MKIGHTLYQTIRTIKQAITSLESDGETARVTVIFDGQHELSDLVSADSIGGVLRDLLSRREANQAVIQLRADGGAVKRTWKYSGPASAGSDTPASDPLGTIPTVPQLPGINIPGLGNIPGADGGQLGAVLAHFQGKDALRDLQMQHAQEKWQLEAEIRDQDRTILDKSRELRETRERLAKAEEEVKELRKVVETDENIDKTLGWAKSLAPMAALLTDNPEKERKIMAFAGITPGTDQAPVTTPSLPAPKNEQERQAQLVWEFLKDPDNADIAPGMVKIIMFFAKYPQLIAENVRNIENPSHNNGNVPEDLTNPGTEPA